MNRLEAVSYTHLDVYKRQPLYCKPLGCSLGSLCLNLVLVPVDNLLGSNEELLQT